jgi:DNA-binding PadR family transcriptional regulator
MTTQIELENLPLTEATFFILLSLAPEPRHGYAIMKEVQTLSDNRVILSTGTLYGALKRLLDQSWIERVDDLTNETDRERKAYALTNLGRRILKAETARLQKLAAIAQLHIQKKQAGT